MAITSSTLKKYGISRNNAVSWGLFPKFPNPSPPPTPHVPSEERADGTKNRPQFYDMELHFGSLRALWWKQIMDLYSYNDQQILLNYRSIAYDLVGGDPVPRWYYAPAIFAEEPTGTPSGTIWTDVVVKFSMVEWYLPS